MANMQKYKLGQLGRILDENARDENYHADRIDSELTKNNYFLSKHCDYSLANSAPRLEEMANRLADAIANHERVAGRSIRSDANLVFSWVVTAPENLHPEDERAFFAATHRFLCDRYGGEDNCLTSVVHKDEPTCRAHLHFDAMPIIDGKFQASKMVNRTDLQTIHSQMNAYVDKELGYHVSIELDEKEAAKKALSKVPHRELTAAKAAIAAEENEAQQRLECLQRSADGIEEEIRHVAEEERGLAEDCRQLEALIAEEQSVPSVGQSVKAIAAAATASRAAAKTERGENATPEEVADLRRRVSEAEKRNRGLEVRSLEEEPGSDSYAAEERRDLEASCSALGERLRALVAKVKELFEEIPIPDRLVAIMREFGLVSSIRWGDTPEDHQRSYDEQRDLADTMRAYRGIEPTRGYSDPQKGYSEPEGR